MVVGFIFCFQGNKCFNIINCCLGSSVFLKGQVFLLTLAALMLILTRFINLDIVGHLVTFSLVLPFFKNCFYCIWVYSICFIGHFLSSL